MPTAASVLADFASLPTIEQNEVKSNLLSPSFIAGQNVDSFITDERFSDGRVCPHCGGKHIVRNGHRKSDGKQTYLCRDCRRSFVAASNSIASRTRKPLSVWEQFIDCMLNGFTIRKTASICKINKKTAFIWRHKVLDALQTMADSVRMDGIIEGYETFFAVSYKGNHLKSITFTMPRASHKRGKSVHKRGLSNEQVCVPCAVNRDGLSIAKVSNLAGVKSAGLNAVYGDRIEPGSVFVSDKDSAYKTFAKANRLELHQLKSGSASRKGIFHLQHINSYHSRLKAFIDRFKGVSTKYLNNYLIWHNYVNYSNSEYDEKKKCMLQYVLGVPISVFGSELSNKDALPLLA